MDIRSRAEAQQRVDQLAAFRAELAIIEQKHVITLDEGQREAVHRYHDQVLARLAAVFDIDLTSRDKQLSLGMRITAFFGAMGLAASVFFFYFQYWGWLATNTQVTILVAMPLAGLLLTMAAVWMERSGYFSKLFALVSLVCFMLDFSLLGQIFNLGPTPHALLVWAAFACLLAYATEGRFLLAMGILCFAAFLSAQTATWNGCYWISFGERPENFLPAALCFFLFALLPQRRYTGFSAIYRIFALLFFFLPALILCNWGALSYIDLAPERIEALYQVLGFVASAAAIGLGIVKGWPETVNSGTVFLTLFLYTKFYDWWWDWMPKYQFFLIIGLTALCMLLILKRMRFLSIRRKAEMTV